MSNPQAVLTASETSGRACPVCRSGRGYFLHTQRFVLPEGHPLSEGYQVVGCERCGFVYANTAVSQADYDLFYARFSKYEDTQTATGGDATPWDVQRLEETAREIAGVISDPQARILDIGCANGGLLGQLKGLGYWQLVGLDPSPACAATTRRLHGLEAWAGSLGETTLDLGQFDCVILSHVLEHVQDLEPAMAALTRLVRPGGLLYVEVPDARRYRDFVTAPFQDFNTEHINHFSPRTLNYLLESRGWEFERGGTKTLVASPNTFYPAFYSFYTRSSSSQAVVEPGLIEPDTELIEGIKAYIAQSQAILDRIERRLQDILARWPEVVVWGTGQLAMKLLAETSLAQARITAFVDSNPINWGQVLRGSPILGPQELQRQGYTGPIIITSILHQAAITRVIRESLNLPNEIVLLD